MSLSLPVGLYFHRYLLLKISALAHRTPASVAGAAPKILTELLQSGSFRKISIYVWEGQANEPSEFHAGDSAGAGELPLRVDWSLNSVSVSVFAEPANSHAEPALDLLGFVSQQIAQLAHAETLRFANATLHGELHELAETLRLGKLRHRAISLLIHKYRVSPAAAEQMLAQASDEHGKPILQVAQEITWALGRVAAAAA